MDNEIHDTFFTIKHRLCVTSRKIINQILRAKTYITRLKFSNNFPL